MVARVALFEHSRWGWLKAVNSETLRVAMEAAGLTTIAVAAARGDGRRFRMPGRESADGGGGAGEAD